MAPVTKPKRQRNRHFFREWREHLKLTQDEAAERIGVTQSKLSRIEKGISPYDQDFLEEAALAYGVSIDTLITRHPIIPTPPIKGDREILETLLRIDGLDQRKAEVVFSMIDAVIDRRPSTPEQSSSDDQPEPSNRHHELKP